MESHAYTRVLIPIEDFEFIDVLIDFIVNHRWSSLAEFKVLHAREWAPVVVPMAGIPVIIPETRQSEELAAAQRLVNSVVQQLHDCLPSKHVEGLVESGDAKEVILRHARDWRPTCLSWPLTVGMG